MQFTVLCQLWIRIGKQPVIQRSRILCMYILCSKSREKKKGKKGKHFVLGSYGSFVLEKTRSK